MKEMREINVECVEWLLRMASPIYWAEASFPRRRFSHLTSNIAKLLNAWLLEAREMPIFGMLDYMRGNMMDWFSEHSAKARDEMHFIV